MAKIQNSKNPIRSAQNVGRVLISIGAHPSIQKGPILAKNCEGHIFGEFWGPEPMGPIGPICPRGPWLLSPLGGLLVSRVGKVKETK